MRWVAIALLLIVACQAEDSSPEGAVRMFVRAVAGGSAGEVFQLLAPSSQRRLVKLAERANAQAGGRSRLRPQDMLAVGGLRMLPGTTADGLPKVSLVDQSADQAQVRLSDGKSSSFEIVECRRVMSRWRIVLSPRLFRGGR